MSYSVRLEDGTLVTIASKETWGQREVFFADDGRMYEWDAEGDYLKLATDSPAASAAASSLTKDIQVKVIDDATALTTGDGKVIFVVPASLNGCNLTAAHAFVSTVSSSGAPTVQIRNITQTADMLTTRITIDASEFTSYTAATAPVIDTANDDVATGDLIAVDVDVAGTGSKGLGVNLTFSLP